MFVPGFVELLGSADVFGVVPSDTVCTFSRPSSETSAGHTGALDGTQLPDALLVFHLTFTHVLSVSQFLLICRFFSSSGVSVLPLSPSSDLSTPEFLLGSLKLILFLYDILPSLSQHIFQSFFRRGFL